jgi:hypothetical protein
MEDNRIFLSCEKCGKKLVERMPNGLFRFIFGKKKSKDGVLLPYSPVYILIHGSIKIRCLSRSCGHFNIFNYFPSQSDNSEKQIERQKTTD